MCQYGQTVGFNCNKEAEAGGTVPPILLLIHLVFQLNFYCDIISMNTKIMERHVKLKF